MMNVKKNIHDELKNNIYFIYKPSSTQKENNNKKGIKYLIFCNKLFFQQKDIFFKIKQKEKKTHTR